MMSDQPRERAMAPGGMIDATETPLFLKCYHCQNEGWTRTEKKIGPCGWIWFAILFLSCCWIGGCLWPVCCDCFKDVEHKCTFCQNTVGTPIHTSHSRLTDVLTGHIFGSLNDHNCNPFYIIYLSLPLILIIVIYLF